MTCPSVERCIGLGWDPDGLGGSPDVYVSEQPSGGALWAAKPIDSGGSTTTMACPSVYLCIVFDRAGNVIIGRARRLDRHELQSLLARSYARRPLSIQSLLRTSEFPLGFKAPLAGHIAVRWLKAYSNRPHRKPLVVAKGQYVFFGAVAQRIQMRLTRTGRALLRGRTHIVVSVEVMYTRPGVAPISTTGPLSLVR